MTVSSFGHVIIYINIICWHYKIINCIIIEKSECITNLGIPLISHRYCLFHVL